MKIFTDDIEYAEKIVDNLSWDKIQIQNLSQKISHLAKKIFTRKEVYTFDTDDNNFWRYLFIVKSAPSSQYDILNSLCRENISLPDGILCLAGEGSGFHGFRNRTWESLPGNIHLSAFLSPGCEVYNFHVGFVILSAISVIQTIDCINELKNKASVKWVNDIIINYSKVSGVLANTFTKGKKVTGVVLGIGINVETTPKVSRDPFVPKVASLQDFTQNTNQCDQRFVFNKLSHLLSSNYLQLLDGKYNILMDFYRNRSLIVGKKVKIFSDPLNGMPEEIIEGKVKDIGENLELLIEGQNKPITKGRLVLKI